MNQQSAIAGNPASLPLTDDQLRSFGYIAWRLLDCGSWVGVLPMTFGKGRLCIDLDYFGYADGYCYSSVKGAIEAMNTLDPQLEREPEGWMRHPSSGRRREGGDPTKEEVYY